MTSLVYEANATAQWHKLVSEAAAACGSGLDEDTESYLVFLLMRFCARPDIGRRALALDYLDCVQRAGGADQGALRDVGDTCLLYSGLFPERARRKRVRVRYFMDLGRAAYHHLATSAVGGWGATFQRLSQRFSALAEVLGAMRNIDGQGPSDLLLLHELWEECGSRRARELLMRETRSVPLRGPGSRQH